MIEDFWLISEIYFIIYHSYIWSNPILFTICYKKANLLQRTGRENTRQNHVTKLYTRLPFTFPRIYSFSYCFFHYLIQFIMLN